MSWWRSRKIVIGLNSFESFIHLRNADFFRKYHIILHYVINEVRGNGEESSWEESNLHNRALFARKSLRDTRQADGQTGLHADRQMEKADRQTDRQTSRQAGRQDEQASRQVGRQAGKTSRQRPTATDGARRSQVPCITSSPQTTPSLLLLDITSLIFPRASRNILRGAV